MNLFGTEHLKLFLQLAEERKQGGIRFSEDEESIIQVMKDHPEFDEFWPMGEMAAAPQEIGDQIVNPFVHTAVHASIELQVNHLKPRYVAETLSVLLDKGTDRHDAIHQIGAIYAELFFKRFRRGDEFDDAEYAARLKDLIDGEDKSHDLRDFE
jgi:hypothetical protein